MSLSKVSSRYAKSLLDLAQERGELDKVHEDVQMMLEVMKNKDFASLLKSPIISMGKKKSIFKAIFDGKQTELMQKFTDIVISKGRESALPAIMRNFVTQYKTLKGVDDLKITSAVELSQKTIDTIKSKLIAQKAISSKIDVVTKVDPSILGGVILEFNGQRYDTSVGTKLRELKKEFKTNLYVSQIVAQ